MSEEPTLYILTGMSGAGKTTALHAFEDMNFFSVDGLPAALLPELAKLLQSPAMRLYRGMAIGMDLRDPDFPENFLAILTGLREKNIKLIFLDASDSELLRRYAATRRPHPLERQGVGLALAVDAERRRLQPIMEKADIRLDSSGFTIYDLRKAIRGHILKQAGEYSGPRINLISFGFKYGIPRDSNYVFDLRFLPNPYFVDNLRPMSGKDRVVSEYVFSSPKAGEFANKVLSLLNFILPLLKAEGRERITVAIGCTGGRHRSVAMAEKLASELSREGYDLILEHRNLDSDLPQSAHS